MSHFSRIKWKANVFLFSTRRLIYNSRYLLQTITFATSLVIVPVYLFYPLKHEFIPRNRDESVEQKWIRDYVKGYIDEYRDELNETIMRMIQDVLHNQEESITEKRGGWWSRIFGESVEKQAEYEIKWNYKKLNLKQHNIQYWDLFTSHPILFFLSKYTDKFSRIASMAFTNWIFHHASVARIHDKNSNFAFDVDLVVYAEDVNGRILIREMELRLKGENIKKIIYTLRDLNESTALRFSSQKYLNLGLPIIAVSPISDSFLSYYGANMTKFLRGMIDQEEHYEDYTSRTQEESIRNAIEKFEKSHI